MKIQSFKKWTFDPKNQINFFNNLHLFTSAKVDPDANC